MTNFSWTVRDRYASGVSDDPPALTPVLLRWSADATWEAESLPWAVPEYPTLLITGIGVTLVTSAVAATRRLSLTIDQPNGGRFEWLSSGTVTASLTRRYELAPGFALDTTLASTTFREPLPHGLFVLPGLDGGPEPQLTLSVVSMQAGDDLGPVTVRGILLLP